MRESVSHAFTPTAESNSICRKKKIAPAARQRQGDATE
jgi:hypothetical protein